MQSVPNIGQYKTSKKSKITVVSFSQYDKKLIAEYKDGRLFKQTYIYTSCDTQDAKYNTYISDETLQIHKVCTQWLLCN